jgi:hypothetical protein
MFEDAVVYYYHGDGNERLDGVPARDLTQVDLDGIGLVHRGEIIRARVARGDVVIPLYTKHEADPAPESTDPPKWYQAYQEGETLLGREPQPMLPGETRKSFEARTATVESAGGVITLDFSENEAPAEGEKG